MQTKERSKRFSELDGLRGIAAVTVVFGHYAVTVGDKFPQHADFPINFRHGGLGVQLFFIVSGFVILMTAERRSQASSFAIARATRLYPTYWACLGLSIAIVYATQFRPFYQPWWVIAANLTMFQSFAGIPDFDDVYWTLARELVFYLIICIVLVLFRRVPRWFAAWFPLAWSLAGLALIAFHSVNPSTFSKILVAATVSQYAPLFGLGMLLYLSRRERSLHTLVGPLTALAVVNEGLMTNWTTGLLVGLICVAVTAVAMAESVPPLRVGILRFLGAISYPLYLLHQDIGFIVIDRLDLVFGRWGSRGLALAISILFAWVVHEFIEVRLSRTVHVWLSSRMESRSD